MPIVTDLTGEKFGRLTVLSRSDNAKDGKAMWLCKCDCGNEKIVSGRALRSGHTKSCGCLCRENTSKASLKNRIGQRFGKLVVVERDEDYISPSGVSHVMWKCLCDCGKYTTVDVCQLVRGHTKSCGCLIHELSGEKNSSYKHGGRHSRLYKVYYNMKNRCYNENADDYKYYGGRGITICDEWLSDFSKFREWAIANGYDESADRGVCTIDRIDVNGNYCPDNCRWVPMSVQSQNRRNVINKTLREQSSKR